MNHDENQLPSATAALVERRSSAIVESVSIKEASPQRESSAPPREVLRELQPSCKFDAVRLLDEEENWRERTVVITRQDHSTNEQLSREILDEVVDNAITTSLNKCVSDTTTSSTLQTSEDFKTPSVKTLNQQEQVIPIVDSISECSNAKASAYPVSLDSSLSSLCNTFSNLALSSAAKQSDKCVVERPFSFVKKLNFSTETNQSIIGSNSEDKNLTEDSTYSAIKDSSSVSITHSNIADTTSVFTDQSNRSDDTNLIGQHLNETFDQIEQLDQSELSKTTNNFSEQNIANNIHSSLTNKNDRSATETSKVLDKSPTETSKVLDKSPTETSKALDKSAAETSEVLDKSATETSEVLDKSATETSEVLDKSATETSKVLDKPATETSKVLDKSAAETTKVLDKSAAETSEALDKSAAETSEVLDQFATETSKVLDKSPTETSKVLDKSAAETSKVLDKSAAETSKVLNKSSETKEILSKTDLKQKVVPEAQKDTNLSTLETQEVFEKSELASNFSDINSISTYNQQMDNNDLDEIDAFKPSRCLNNSPTPNEMEEVQQLQTSLKHTSPEKDTQMQIAKDVSPKRDTDLLAKESPLNDALLINNLSTPANVLIKDESVKKIGSANRKGGGDGAEEQFQAAEEFFQDASEFDFLSEKGGGTVASNLARESLYVKFDPLLGRPSVAPSVAAAAAAAAQGDGPAIDKRLTIGEKLIAFSPAKKDCEDGTLLSSVQQQQIKTEMVEMKQNVSTTSSSITMENVKFNQIMKNQELHFQEQILMKDRDIATLQQRLAELESVQSNETTALHEVRNIVQTYEQRIGRMTRALNAAKKHHSTRESVLEKDRDEAREELNRMEAMFSDLHRKYERTKSSVVSTVRKETELTECVTELQTRLDKEIQRYEMLQQHASEMLAEQKRETEETQRSRENEAIRLSTLLKLTENKNQKLEKENKELTTMCEDLVSKLG